MKTQIDKVICLSLFILLSSISYSQNVGINSSGATPNATALLDVDASPSNDKGILVPRIPLTITTSNAPVGAAIATSLLVYNTATVNDVTPGYYYWDGAKWVRLLGNNNAWLLLGNAGTVAGTNFLGTTDAVDLVFKTTNTERMRVLSTGNVGIATSSPAALLEVSETSASSVRGIVSTQYNASSIGARLILRKARGTSAAPTAALSGDNTGLVVYGSYDGSSFVDGATVESKAAQNWSAGATGCNLLFTTTTNGTTGRQQRMIIDDAGNVGIGTTTPSYPFHVYNSQNGVAYSGVENPNAGASAMAATISKSNAGMAGFWIASTAAGAYAEYGTTSSGGMYYTVYNASGDHAWRTTPLAVERMRLTNAGDLGIGTNAPTALLSVNGTANNTTGVWAIFSDARIKTVNADFKDGLELIKQIHPVKFTYNTNAPFTSDQEQIGIVAQELEKIAPYMVSKKEYKQYKDLREVNNQAYVYILINAVKELNNKDEELQKKIETLAAENKNLKTEILLLKSQYGDRLKALEEILNASAKR